MILGFSHPAIVVPDINKARDFYEEMFGFRQISIEGWENNPDADRATGMKNARCRGFMLAGHNCYLEIFEFSAPEQRFPGPENFGPQELGIRHLSFYVDDVEKETSRFLQLGGSYLGEPTIGVVYLRDPFGIIIELCLMPNKNENLLNLPGINALGSAGSRKSL